MSLSGPHWKSDFALYVCKKGFFSVVAFDTLSPWHLYIVTAIVVVEKTQFVLRMHLFVAAISVLPLSLNKLWIGFKRKEKKSFERKTTLHYAVNGIFNVSNLDVLT